MFGHPYDTCPHQTDEGCLLPLEYRPEECTNSICYNGRTKLRDAGILPPTIRYLRERKEREARGEI